MTIEESLAFADSGKTACGYYGREAMKELAAEVRRLTELREGDSKLVRVLAEDAGIIIRASDKLPGAQWEQFHAGVIALARRGGSAGYLDKGWPIWYGHWKPCPFCSGEILETIMDFCQFCAGSKRIRVWEAPTRMIKL